MKKLFLIPVAMMMATPAIAASTQDILNEIAAHQCELRGSNNAGNAQLLNINGPHIAYSCGNTFYTQGFDYTAEDVTSEWVYEENKEASEKAELQAQIDELRTANQQLQDTINQAQTDVQSAHDTMYWYINGHVNIGQLDEAILLLQNCSRKPRWIHRSRIPTTMKKLLLIPLLLVSTTAAAYTYNPDNYGYNYSGAELADPNYGANTHLNSQIANLEAELANANSIIAEQQAALNENDRTIEQQAQTIKIQNDMIAGEYDHNLTALEMQVANLQEQVATLTSQNTALMNTNVGQANTIDSVQVQVNELNDALINPGDGFVSNVQTIANALNSIIGEGIFQN